MSTVLVNRADGRVPKWWHTTTVYQIYPASYKSSTGESTGDLKGIISKLDYLKELGVGCLWINPFFKSPQFDMGYDVADYTLVDPLYGNNEDAEALIKGAHDRGMKIVFDLVINHTSQEHEWFKESRSSKDNPKRDWYIWRPAKIGKNGERRPPNNWRSYFGGSVWEWDENTEEYYLHYFCREQPDLNWESKAARDAIYKDACLFWLDKGIDGYRIDTVNMYSKFLDFPDAPIREPAQEWQWAGDKYSNGPTLHQHIKEMTQETFEKYDAVTIGECPNTFTVDGMMKFVSAKEKQLSMCFQFTLADIDHGGQFPLDPRAWKLPEFKSITKDYQELIDPKYDGWAATYLGNHDQARPVTRFGNDSEEHRVASAKMLATYTLTLSGTPFIYQGEEIGMINAPRDWDIDTEYIDVNTIGMMKELRAIGDPAKIAKGEQGVRLYGRDHARTPMQWDDTENAGFSAPGSKKPWMRVMDSYKQINVASQLNDPSSTLAFYRQLLQLRKEHPDGLVYGVFELLDPENESTMTYIKRGTEESFHVSLNFTDKPQPVVGLPKAASLLLSSAGLTASDPLAPYEGRIYTI